MYAFGQNISYTFYPLLDSEAATIPAAVLSQTPDIFVFPDNVPTRNAAATGSGSIAVINSWTWNPNRKAWSFVVPAIDDPDPDSNIAQRTYWIAINFVLQSTQQTQTVLKPLQMVRVMGHDKVVAVNQDDLKKYFPQVEAYSSELQRVAYIGQAIEEVKSYLRAKGFEWAKIQRADRLELCVIFKALSMIMLAQVQESGDKFALKYQEFKASFTQNIESLRFEYQEQEGGTVSEAKSNGTLFLVR
jgi:hypothetical protein